MGLKVTNYFDNSKYEAPDLKIITCKGCSSHLCLSSLIVSDNFNGSSGPAYLVDNLINIEYDLNPQEKEMRTGFYLVDDIRCHQCKLNLGWYYKKSFTFRETYKEGKFVIEKSFIKFIDNNTSNNLLIEKALKNKFRRRFSSTSTLSSDELDFNPNINHQNPHQMESNAISTNHPFTAITTIPDNSMTFNKPPTPSHINYPPSLMVSGKPNDENKPPLRLIDTSSLTPKRKSLDYRSISNGLFLNGLRIPVSTTTSSSSSSTTPIVTSSSSSTTSHEFHHHQDPSPPPTIATIAIAAAAAAAAATAAAGPSPSSNSAASTSSTTTPSTRPRNVRHRHDEEDDNDVFVDA